MLNMERRGERHVHLWFPCFLVACNQFLHAMIVPCKVRLRRKLVRNMNTPFVLLVSEASYHVADLVDLLVICNICVLAKDLVQTFECETGRLSIHPSNIQSPRNFFDLGGDHRRAVRPRLLIPRKHSIYYVDSQAGNHDNSITDLIKCLKRRRAHSKMASMAHRLVLAPRVRNSQLSRRNLRLQSKSPRSWIHGRNRLRALS